MSVIASILSQERASTTRPAGRAEWAYRFLPGMRQPLQAVEGRLERYAAQHRPRLWRPNGLADPAASHGPCMGYSTAPIGACIGPPSPIRTKSSRDDHTP
jgi:hypothetical protein